MTALGAARGRAEAADLLGSTVENLRAAAGLPPAGPSARMLADQLDELAERVLFAPDRRAIAGDIGALAREIRRARRPRRRRR